MANDSCVKSAQCSRGHASSPERLMGDKVKFEYCLYGDSIVSANSDGPKHYL